MQPLDQHARASTLAAPGPRASGADGESRIKGNKGGIFQRQRQKNRLAKENRNLGRRARHFQRVVSKPQARPLLELVRAPADLELAARCVAGERAAQRALFERERRRVHSTLLRIVGPGAQLDDLIQDAFVEIFRSLETFRGEASLSTWITRCTVRVAYAHFRRKAVVPRLEPVVDLMLTLPSAEQRLLHREAARRLYTLLDRLKPAQRIAFTLHELDGKPLKEVALLMDASVVSTKLRVYRARGFIERCAKNDPLLREFVMGEG
jgi:RNA polymerase sigma-70 factor, ECF subfamily